MTDFLTSQPFVGTLGLIAFLSAIGWALRPPG
jgi:hypothetical protein